MFKKPPPPPTDLSARIRGAVSRPAQAGPPAPPPPSRRKERAERDKVFRQATLVLSDGHRFAVVVKDVSETGARVEFFQHVTLPDEVQFLEATLRLRKRARVVWQRDGVAGLAFLD
ncbi:MAG TPA: PilZ domain-containing protein [Verrucomicrobiae bacterium]|nr:PilZ domain-containing protein [Verrucomicrobiae bacterium]